MDIMILSATFGLLALIAFSPVIIALVATNIVLDLMNKKN